MNGHGVFTWANGKKEFEGNFCDDQITGHGLLVQEVSNDKVTSTFISQGRFQQGLLHGFGVRFESRKNNDDVNNSNTKLIITVGNNFQIGELVEGLINFLFFFYLKVLLLNFH